MRNNIAFLSTDVGRLFRKRFDAVAREFGVTGPQWRVLVHLDRTPGINQGTLADRLEVEAITVGRMIDRLEKADMVERRPDPADRRAWRLYLRDGAQPLLGQLRTFADEVMREAMAGFSDEEHDQLIDMLERVRANLCDEIPETQVAHG
ncbi:MAG: MarR family transcriptional regulator [Sphingomonadales bacterium]|nr:MarR family transcriptional regulator [Sphingomonadales bacterium]MDE2568462.1 MarR family transcriptional regulator [Sphingomonadales bacterium]